MFPLNREIQLKQNNLRVTTEDVLQHVYPLLTEERRQKIERVTAGRCFDISVVLESIYDRGNISAVMRTAEGLGFSNFHVIETFEKFKEANRVTQGADKWVEVKKWKTTRDYIDFAKKNKIRICVTSLEASKPIHEVDFTSPLALVLGNEKSGVSPEILEAADERVIIPMPGFVQSFNISVAGALCLYQIYQDRLRRRGQVQDVTPEQIEILKAHYALRTLDSAEDILKSHLAK
ncbi:TrmH family RNA methyltransferase [Pseudobdellovibrio exovorus]|uniref:tRNA (guanosine(18)-2'-O)-methyltransferase n=1 Tax=Pseudobdellovibrio exovorus JSS TaxID=1184267 RepID=M4VRU0_9BACT|nr:RNA methyltransferase [Pseudobdellovibrio exovorus]AGH95904.1 putative RNA methylase [Pseudobdellovibrio exovorus JSS]